MFMDSSQSRLFFRQRPSREKTDFHAPTRAAGIGRLRTPLYFCYIHRVILATACSIGGGAWPSKRPAERTDPSRDSTGART
jgi:hypothetical protein